MLGLIIKAKENFEFMFFNNIISLLFFYIKISLELIFEDFIYNEDK